MKDSGNARAALPAAELRMKELLDQLNFVEAALRSVSASHPTRPLLKQQKESVLGNYRQAKERVKELRRNGGATPDMSPAQRAAMAVLADGVVLQKLYVALAEARDRDRADGDPGSFLTPGERDAIDEFLDVWEIS